MLLAVELTYPGLEKEKKPSKCKDLGAASPVEHFFI